MRARSSSGVSVADGLIRNSARIAAPATSIAIAPTPATIIHRPRARNEARPSDVSGTAALAVLVPSTRARAEAGRSSGRGSSIGVISGRSDAGSPERSGIFCRAAIDAPGVAPMSSVLPKPSAAAASTKPRL